MENRLGGYSGVRRTERGLMLSIDQDRHHPFRSANANIVLVESEDRAPAAIEHGDGVTGTNEFLILPMWPKEFT